MLLDSLFFIKHILYLYKASLVFPFHKFQLQFRTILGSRTLTFWHSQTTHFHNFLKCTIFQSVPFFSLLPFYELFTHIFVFGVDVQRFHFISLVLLAKRTVMAFLHQGVPTFVARKNTLLCEDFPDVVAINCAHGCTNGLWLLNEFHVLCSCKSEIHPMCWQN